MLATVKAWPGGSEIWEAMKRRPSLTVAARDVVKDAGRDEETALRSNKETARYAIIGAAPFCHGVPRATTVFAKMSIFLAQATIARLWPLPAAISRS